MLVLLVASAKILAVKAGTTINPAHLPCWPTCLVGPPALLAHLPCWPNCLVSRSVLFGFSSLRLLLVYLLIEVEFCKLICLEQTTSLGYSRKLAKAF
jgi:hypothetical protein